jgi:hypothetical protein
VIGEELEAIAVVAVAAQRFAHTAQRAGSN